MKTKHRINPPPAAASARYCRRAASVVIGATGLFGLVVLAGCLNVHVDPVEVKPITLNVNVHYVDEQLDDFYSFEKKYAARPATAPSTMPVGGNPSEVLSGGSRNMQ